MFFHGEFAPCFFVSGIGAADVGTWLDELDLKGGGGVFGQVRGDGDRLAGARLGRRMADGGCGFGGRGSVRDDKYGQDEEACEGAKRVGPLGFHR